MMAGPSGLLPSFDGTSASSVYAGREDGPRFVDPAAAEARLLERYEAGHRAGLNEGGVLRAQASAALEQSLRGLAARIDATIVDVRRELREDGERLLASALAYALPALVQDARGVAIAAQLRSLVERIAAPEVRVRLASDDHAELVRLGIDLPGHVVIEVEPERPRGRVDLDWRGGHARFDPDANLAHIRKELETMSASAATRNEPAR